MTDNEKRAHDLTLLYIQETNRLKMVEAKSTTDKPAEVRMDFYSDYVDLYPRILEKINEYFS